MPVRVEKAEGGRVRTLAVSVAPGRVARFLVAAVLVLAALSLLSQAYRAWLGWPDSTELMRFFDVNKEENLPTAVACLIVLFAALLLALIGAATWQRARGAGDRLHASEWLLLAAIFVALAVDDALRFHETMMIEGLTIQDTNPWVVVGLLFVAAVAALFVPFLLRLPRRTAVRFVVAGALVVGASLGLEILDDKLMARGLYPKRGAVHTLFVTAEEACEMLGFVVFVHALLVHATAAPGGLEVRLPGGRRLVLAGAPAAITRPRRTSRPDPARP